MIGHVRRSRAIDRFKRKTLRKLAGHRIDGQREMPLGLLIPGVALFERGWLFSGKGRKVNQPTIVAADSAVFTTTTDDYIEWQRLLTSGKRPPAKRGMTLKDEYEQWAAARAQARAAGASTDQPA